VYLFAAMAVPVWMAVQDNQELKDRYRKYTAQQGRSAYTGAVRAGNQNSARAVDGSINDSNRDVRYTVTAIGVVLGEQSSFLPIAGTVNNSGALAGYSYNGPFGGSNDFFLTAVGFTWKHGVLQPLPLLSGWPGAFAFGLNNNKLVFGVANNVDNLGNIVQTPVLWNGGSPINLGIPAGYSSAFAIGINDRGQVVVDAFSAVAFNPFIWYKGQITPLPLLPGGVNGFASGINDQDEIVGYMDFGSSPPPGTGEFHSVLWTPKRKTTLYWISVVSRDIFSARGSTSTTVAKSSEPLTMRRVILTHTSGPAAGCRISAHCPAAHLARHCGTTSPARSSAMVTEPTATLLISSGRTAS